MRVTAGLLLVGLLTIGQGYTQTDWIDRTLVTSKLLRHLMNTWP